MILGHKCVSMDVQGVVYPLLPSSVTPDVYILVRVHALRCPIVVEPLFNQSSPVIFLLPGNAQVKRVRPKLTTRHLS